MTYEMAMVVSLAFIIADEFQRIAFHNVFRMSSSKVLDGVPKSRDGFDILVQTKGKAVLLLVLRHPCKRIVVNITVEFNAGLNAPVLLVI